MRANIKFRLEEILDENGIGTGKKELVLRDVANERFLASWNSVHEKVPTTHYIVGQALLMAYELGLRDRGAEIKKLLG